jgi:vacuolar-type H+-ATPase subunit E/Vma4
VEVALDDDAKANGAGKLARSSAEADRVIEQARADAEQIVRSARNEGTTAGSRLASSTRAAARRDAREIVLGARDDAYRLLRRRVLEELALRSGSEEASKLNSDLERGAVALLGTGATLRRDPLGVGLAAAPHPRRVDTSAERLVDSCLTELGAALERLWS